MLTLLLVLPLAALLQGPGHVHVRAEEADVVEGEEGTVEDDGPPTEGAVVGEKQEEGEEGEDDAQPLKPHPDADTFFLVTKPTGMGLELPAGKDVHFLVGFANKGNREMFVETMDASFRYAMDFSYHLQNFTAIAYNKVVKPQEEVTLSYSFFVSEAYSTRPYGFTVNLFYKDVEGNQYMNAVFNETVSIVELDEGLDGETFFLYLFLAAFVVLGLVAAQQFLSSMNKKRSSSKPNKSGIEKGTSNPNDVDYDWLPQGTLDALSKSPKAGKQSPRTSPRQRRAKRATGSGDD